MAKDLENTMVGNNVYLLTEITPESTNGLIIQLTQWVDNLPILRPKTEYRIYTPYEPIPKNTPVLNVWINCCGGNTNQRQSILTLFDIASIRGTVIKTYNLRQASSCASQIAVSGTHGYRYMSESAYNFIHFGSMQGTVKHANEIEYISSQFTQQNLESRDIYLRNTKLTKKELTKFQNEECSGMLYAQQCLQKGLCDWVITNDGRFINSVAELTKQNTR